MKVLPTLGLKNIEVIRLENTPLLTTIPPIYTLAVSTLIQYYFFFKFIQERRVLYLQYIYLLYI